LVGYSASVVRASVMAGLFLLTILLDRPYYVFRMLVLAGFMMVMVEPYSLRYDIGFQLSFMATLGLILVAPQLEVAWSQVTTWFSVRSFLIATVATQIAVAPLLLYYMGEWSIIAIVANILVLPMVPLAMLTTFSTGLVALVIPQLVLPLALLANLTLWYIIMIATTLARLPYAAISVPPFPPGLVLVLYICLALSWYWYTIYRQPRVIKESELRNNTSISGWTIVAESSISTLLPDISKVTTPYTSTAPLPTFFTKTDDLRSPPN
jgi:competence protein ComEC